MKNDKQELCETHKTYLEIIYYFGNKVMVNKQLFEVVEAMGLEKNREHFYYKMNKLVSAGIIDKSVIYGFTSKPSAMMYKLKKYAIRFLEDKNGSGSVGAVPKNPTERLSLSLFKTSYIITEIIPQLRKMGQPLSVHNIKVLLTKDHSSLLFKKNKGIDYLTFLYYKAELEKVLEKHIMAGVWQDMQNIVVKKEEGLLKGRKSTKGKGFTQKKDKTIPIIESDEAKEVLEAVEKEEVKKVEPKNIERKNETIVNYNFDSMIFAHTYVSQLKENKDGVWEVTVLVFDVRNKQSVHKMLQNIACIYQMFQMYLTNAFKLNVEIIAFDEAGAINMSQEALKEVKNGQTKEVRGNREAVTLENWGVQRSELENITIQYTHYDLTNRYFDGIKHLNLKR